MFYCFYGLPKSAGIGSEGFLVSFVVKRLRQRGKDIIVLCSKEHDLRDRDVILGLHKKIQPKIVIRLAAVVGGIGASWARFVPTRSLYPCHFVGPHFSSENITRIERTLTANLQGVSVSTSLVPAIERNVAASCGR